MKVISLNTLGGKLFEPLMVFIQEEAPACAAFCMQEMYRGSAELAASGERLNLFELVSAALPDFEASFAGAVRFADGVEGGEAMFVRRALAPAFDVRFAVGEYMADYPQHKENWPAVLHSAQVGDLTLAHVHGVAYPGHKEDTPERLEQSRVIADYVRSFGTPAVLCGDFNLLPDTESVRTLERTPLRNLITEYGIQSTRPEEHLRKYAPEDRQHFADYMFVSPEVAVHSFEVPALEVSDHLPLILEIN